MSDTRLIDPTVPAQFVSEMLEGARSKGVEVNEILNKAGVGRELLSNLHTRISVKLYYRILSTVRKHLKDEMLGFLDHRVPATAFPVFCEAATGFHDLQGVFDFSNKYYGLFTDEFRWEFETDPEKNLTSLCVRFKKAPECYKKFLIEFLLLTPYKASSWLAGEQYTISSVHFTFPKSLHGDKHHYLFGTNVNYGSAANKIVFDTGVLRHPVIRSQKETSHFLKSSLGWFLLTPDARPMTRQVRQKLMAGDPVSGFPSFEEIARSLHISHQHLWRKLNMEGTSYQQIKNSLRRDLAIHFLTTTNLTIDEIAYKVGYGAQRPFYRMFSRWAGMSPGEYRRIWKA